MVPLKLSKDNITWVESKLSGAAGALGAETLELKNWLLMFGCTSKELQVEVSGIVDWITSSSLLGNHTEP